MRSLVEVFEKIRSNRRLDDPVLASMADVACSTCCPYCRGSASATATEVTTRIDPTPFDWIRLRREDITAVLASYGFTSPRVVGRAGAGLDLPAPAEIQVDKPPVIDLTSGDLRRLGQQLSALVGLDILVLPVVPGGTDLQPGEKVRYL